MRGLVIAKRITWTAGALMMLSALGSFASAEQIKDALKREKAQSVYDPLTDKDYDDDDETRQRRIGRAMFITGLIPIGLAVWTTVLHAKRTKQQRLLGYQLEDVAQKRRSVLQRLGAEVGVAPSLASVRLKLAF